MPRVLIGFGANLGSPNETLARAVDDLVDSFEFKRLEVSRSIKTPPQGGPSGQPPYVNCVASFETERKPLGVLAATQSVEHRLGRSRSTAWAARRIDLDLLLYDDVVLHCPELVLPHPRMAWRRFVLEPAVEITPDWIHPVLGWTLRRMLDHLDNAAPYFALIGADRAAATAAASRIAAQAGVGLIVDDQTIAREEAIRQKLSKGEAVVVSGPFGGGESHGSAAAAHLRPKLLIALTNGPDARANRSLRARIARSYKGPVLWSDLVHPGLTWEEEAAVAIRAMTPDSHPDR